MNYFACAVIAIFVSTGCSYFSDVNNASTSDIVPFENGRQQQVESIPLEPTYKSVQKNILDQKCVSCHTPGSPVGRIPLNKYEDLLNSPLDIVLPGNSEESGIILVASSQDEDVVMPPPFFKNQPTGYLPLSPEEILTIQEWIDQGALNN